MKQKTSPIRESIFLKFIIALISIRLWLDYALGRYAVLLYLVGHNFSFWLFCCLACFYAILFSVKDNSFWVSLQKSPVLWKKKYIFGDGDELLVTLYLTWSLVPLQHSCKMYIWWLFLLCADLIARVENIVYLTYRIGPKVCVYFQCCHQAHRRTVESELISNPSAGQHVGSSFQQLSARHGISSLILPK